MRKNLLRSRFRLKPTEKEMKEKVLEEEQKTIEAARLAEEEEARLAKATSNSWAAHRKGHRKTKTIMTDR